MIFKFLIEICLAVFRGLFSAFELFKLPVDLIGTLSTILSYGVWIVGADIMGIFVGSVVFWWGVHTSIGLAVWLWNKLPLS